MKYWYGFEKLYLLCELWRKIDLRKLLITLVNVLTYFKGT